MKTFKQYISEESKALSRFRAQQGVGREALLAKGAITKYSTQQQLDKADQLQKEIESQSMKLDLDNYFMNKRRPFVDLGYTDQYGRATPV